MDLLQCEMTEFWNHDVNGSKLVQCAQVAFTKPCLVKGIVKRASLEVCSKRLDITSDLKLLFTRRAAHRLLPICMRMHDWPAGMIKPYRRVRQSACSTYHWVLAYVTHV